MSEPVLVDDVAAPAEPETDLDVLARYLAGRFPERKSQINALMARARDLSDKGTVVELVYESLLFRSEVDEWLAFAAQILEESHGDQLGLAHSEQATEAKERGSTRPLSKVVEARAQQFTAPLRRAVAELRSTRELLDKILFWCQAQPKLIRDEEYGSLLEASNTPSDRQLAEGAPVVHPPSPALALSRLQRGQKP